MMSNKGLSKLLEELGELSQISAKKLAYMDTYWHPDNAGNMHIRLEEEMGDVLASIEFVRKKLFLDSVSIRERKAKKLALYEEWDKEE